jgi:uncharacterized membrane protein YbhN (UPF0104 family)
LLTSTNHAPSAGLPTVEAPAGGAADSFPARLFRRRRLRFLLMAAVIGVEVALVVPHVDDGRAVVGQLHWGWLVGAVGCEAVSVLTFARMRGVLLRAAGVVVPMRRLNALTLASSAITISVPAGPAVSTGYFFRHLRRGGASASVLTWTIVAAAVVSSLAFTVLTLGGAVLDGDGTLDGVLSRGGVSALGVVGLIALLVILTRRPRPCARAAVAALRRVPILRHRVASDDHAADALVTKVVGQLGAIRPRPHQWGAAVVLGIVNWLADLACFVLCCHGVGISRLALGAAVLTYVAGLATSGISLLPSGLGSVEAAMLLGLTHAGVTAGSAVAGILAYRIVAYALVAAVGWVFWAGLRRGIGRLNWAGRAHPPPQPVP